MAISSNTATEMASLVDVGLKEHLKKSMRETIEPLRDEIIKKLDSQIEEIINNTCESMEATIHTRRSDLNLRDEILIEWSIKK